MENPDSFSGLSLEMSGFYKPTQKLEYLDNAITESRNAVTAMSHASPDRELYVGTLGRLLYFWYKHTGTLEDLQQVAANYQQASETPLDQINRTELLSNLASRLSMRYRCTRVMDDLHQAIDLGQEALEAMPPDSDQTSRAGLLSALANKFSDRYGCTGAMGGLRHAISLGQEALEAAPLGHTDQAKCLSNLANFISNLYDYTGARTTSTNPSI